MYTFKIVIVLISIFSVGFAERENDVEYNERDTVKKIGMIKDTKIEDNPYQVSVIVETRKYSGIIISSSWVMTVAHILPSTTLDTFIRAGSDFQDSEGTLFTTDRKVLHPDFNPSTIDYDFALIRINGTFVNGLKIKPAVLPEAGQNVPIIGKMQISGWGSKRTGGANYAKLKYFDINYVPYFYCNATYKTITDRMFCGGNWFIGGIGACHGGSGAPVRYKNVVVGMVSFVNGYCGGSLKPDVYSKISSVIPWIKSTTGI